MNRASLLVTFAMLAIPTAALAESPTPPPAPMPMPVPAAQPAAATKHVGIGYKAGNGIGFMGGDVIVNFAPHVGVDLQASFFQVSAGNDTGTGYAFAPAVHGELYTGQRSTPYAAVGFQYAHLTLVDASGTGTGGFVNLGYEWKWDNGFGIQLGGGVQYLSKIEATAGNMMLVTGGKVNPNIEFGLRYMFL